MKHCRQTRVLNITTEGFPFLDPLETSRENENVLVGLAEISGIK